jgi:hypothetical protein
MPADIRNFFGGKPAATTPKQEKALGTKDNVCTPCLFVVGISWLHPLTSILQYNTWEVDHVLRIEIPLDILL